jgi:hypothetical protein
MLEQNLLPYSLFLNPYLLFNSPTVETVGYKNIVKIEIEKCWNELFLEGSRGL